MVACTAKMARWVCRAFAGVIAGAALLVSASPANATGEGAVFAKISPTPGYPRGIALGKHDVYVATAGRSTAGSSGASEIQVFRQKNGASVRTIPITGEDLGKPHALAGIALDKHERIYVLSSQLGLLRLKKHGKKFEQSTYADGFPDLEPCNIAPAGAPCSPTDLDLPPLPGDLAFLEDGTAFVTDAQQATLYRVPAGGGKPEIWLQSSKQAGFFDLAGVSAVCVSPDGKSLYVTVSFCAEAPWEGRIYRIPLKTAPTDEDIELVYAFENFEAPDGLAFGQDGLLYLALSVTNEIAIVAPETGEVSRFGGPEGSSIPFDGPARVAFDKRGSLLVTNLASVSDVAAHFAVLKVVADDDGAPLFYPKIP